MALPADLVLDLAAVEGAAFALPRDRYGHWPIPHELSRLLVALTEEVARLDARVKELEARL